jgi:hypothetical protein
VREWLLYCVLSQAESELRIYRGGLKWQDNVKADPKEVCLDCISLIHDWL